MKNKTTMKDQEGGAAIEFALILPLLIALIFGIIEGGLVLYNKQIFTNACREGMRAAVIVRQPRLDDGEIATVVKQYAQNYLVTFGNNTLEDADINISPPYSDPARNPGIFGTDLIMDATYAYNFLVLSAFGFGPITLHARTIMKME